MLRRKRELDKVINYVCHLRPIKRTSNHAPPHPHPPEKKKIDKNKQTKETNVVTENGVLINYRSIV